MKLSVILLLVILSNGLFGQTNPGNLKVNYLNEIPIIDGLPDKETVGILFQKFSFVTSTDSLVKTPEARFRIASRKKT